MGAPLLKLPPPRLEQYYARWNAIAPRKLSASSAEPLTLAQLLELAGPEERELWEHLDLGYASSAGDELLREEIAGLYRSKPGSKPA